MLAGFTLVQLQFSSPARVAPRSALARGGAFSSSLALSDAQTKLCAGDDEGLLQEHARHNLALMITSLRYATDKTVLNDNTLVWPTHDLCPVQEDERYPLVNDYHRQHSLDRSKTLAGAYREQNIPLPFHTFSVDDATNSASAYEYGRAALNASSTVRSLTAPSVTSTTIMTAVVSAPGSPPALTESHSSKSSSYASQLSSPDEFSGGSMNFEEINLDDEEKHSRVDRDERRSDNKENLRKNGSLSKRPALATIQTKHTTGLLRSVENGSRSAATPDTKRNFTSPVVLASSSKNVHRTRSESPALHKTRSSAGLGQHAQTPATSLAIPGRRGSWQPARKTIYELEAEYHDSDDELPDDASLFNVPISPFVHGQRSLPHSARSSARGSPERDSPSRSPGPVPLSHARSVPDFPPRRVSSSKALPRQRKTPKPSSSQSKKAKSGSTSPRNDLRYGRAKSWNIVLSDLDYEARVIAEKLEFHHETAASRQTTAHPSHRSSAPGAIPLPPIQRGALDFMPFSKEKEAVLSRTRPSWLPPKDPKEEKRHLEEYKKMMKASIEADRKREEKLKNSPTVDEATRDSLHRIWAYYVEPATDLSIIDKRVNDLCWRGIPPAYRGRVWQRTVGNALELTRNSYFLAGERAREIKSKPAEKLSRQERSMREWFADIERDAETAFPDLSMFRRRGPQWQDLIDLCEAYAVFRKDIGYSYGMQLVAAVILLQVPDPAEAFILMANALNRPMPLAFQAGDCAATARTYGKVKSTLDIKFPKLHAYLFDSQADGGLGFTGEELFDAMFRTLFANGLDLDRLCRVWDIWVFEGDRYLVRTAVALLGALRPQIFDMQGDIDLRRRNIQEMLGWGPCNRTRGGYWTLATAQGGDSFVEEVRAAGTLDCTGN